MPRRVRSLTGRADIVRKNQATTGANLIAIIALPFAVIGLVACYNVASTVRTWIAARGWAEVSATPLSASLETRRTSKGKQYRVLQARYRYSYGGQMYESDRLALETPPQGIGSFDEELYRKLTEARASGSSVPCYVDPVRPQQAVLDRELRVENVVFWAAFGFIFGGVGFGMLLAAVVGLRNETRRAMLSSRYPEEPWRHRDEWNQRVARCDSGAMLWPMVVLSLILFGFSLPLILVIPPELGKGNFFVFLALIFPAIALLAIGWTVRLLILHRRYGGATFTMDELPFRRGGELSGTIHLPKLPPADAGAPVVRLTCNVTTIRRSGGKSRRQTQEAWRGECPAPIAPPAQPGSRGSLAVRLAIPESLPPTGKLDPQTTVIWRLVATASALGAVDLEVPFEVPVF